MKTINLQEYQKDKAIEKIKEIIQESFLDETLKAMLIGMLDIDAMNFNSIGQMERSIIEIYNKPLNQISEALKQHTDTLYQDIPKFMQSTNELNKAYQDDITTLKLKIGELEERINK
jgi:hypothetical protein